MPEKLAFGASSSVPLLRTANAPAPAVSSAQTLPKLLDELVRERLAAHRFADGAAADLERAGPGRTAPRRAGAQPIASATRGSATNPRYASVVTTNAGGTGKPSARSRARLADLRPTAAGGSSVAFANGTISRRAFVAIRCAPRCPRIAVVVRTQDQRSLK